ncbi:PHP domain-containing protein [candidate division KSB1 bacterium]|nr:PHP domain-containing protein [candidate division KSB1 bacterium]
MVKEFQYDLHCHSNFSFDCNTKIEDLIKNAIKVGLSGIAITDHDTIEGVIETQKLGAPIKIIPGIEKTLDDGSHIIGLFVKKEIKSKCLFEVISEIRGQGGRVIIPHPFKEYTGLFRSEMKRTEEFKQYVLTLVDGIEIYNAKYSFSNNQLMKGIVLPNRLPRLAVSDSHYSFTVGRGRTGFSNEITNNRLPKNDSIYIETRSKSTSNQSGKPKKEMAMIKYVKIIAKMIRLYPFLKKLKINYLEHKNYRLKMKRIEL